MAKFIQIIEYTTSRFDDVLALAQEWDAAEGDPVSRVTIVADRDRPDTYQTIVEFPDYETAMANSERPETSAYAERMAALCDGPPKFYNLDVKLGWPE